MTDPTARIIGGPRPPDPFDARTPDPGAAAEARARMWVAGIYEGPARPALFMDGPTDGLNDHCDACLRATS